LLVAHVSDTHLGASQFNLKGREEDVYEALAEVVEVAIKDNVQMLIHSGDIFNDPRPGGTALSALTDQLKKLKDKGIPVFFTLGEHDISRLPGTPSAAVFQKLGLGFYIGRGEPIVHGGVMIVGYHKYRKGEIDDLLEKLNGLDSTTSEHEGPKILVLHQGIAEAHKYASELNTNDLPKTFDYYAMGHLHDRFEKKFEALGGIVCYPGSTDPTGVEGIETFKKGFYITDLSGSEALPEWVELKSTRPQMELEVDYDKLRGTIKQLISQFEGLLKKPVVILNVKGTEIDGIRVAKTVEPLRDCTLYYEWNPMIESRGAKNLKSKPADINEEMFNLALEITKREDLASFAIKELLPLLQEESTKEATELLWKAYEQGRFPNR